MTKVVGLHDEGTYSGVKRFDGSSVSVGVLRRPDIERFGLVLRKFVRYKAYHRVDGQSLSGISWTDNRYAGSSLLVLLLDIASTEHRNVEALVVIFFQLVILLTSGAKNSK